MAALQNQLAWDPVCPRVLFSDPYSFWPILMTSLPRSSLCRWLPPVSPDKMSSRSGAAAEKPICVTGLGRSMGDVFQPLEMLGPEGVQAEIKKLEFEYPLKGETLVNASSTPYIVVCLSETLEWEAHINRITSEANSTLGFLRRNLKACPPKLRETAYFSLVRSSLEYSSAVWDPFRQKDIDKLEKIQRSAARFVTQNYRQTASVTSLIQNLGWTDLKTRRKNSRLVSMFKILMS